MIDLNFAQRKVNGHRAPDDLLSWLLRALGRNSAYLLTYAQVAGGRFRFVEVMTL